MPVHVRLPYNADVEKFEPGRIAEDILQRNHAASLIVFELRDVAIAVDD